MEPTLRAGDRLLVRRGVEAPRPGALVVVRLPDGPDGPRPEAVKRLRRVEPSGALWVESDALGVGTDSWTLGALPPDHLLGRVVLRLPRRRDGRGAAPWRAVSGPRPGRWARGRR
jgi:hypothetical protein